MKKVIDSAFSRVIILGILMLSFSIPLAMMRNAVSERAGYYEDAESSIAQSWASQQTIAAPVLAIPYTLEDTLRIAAADGQSEQIKKSTAQKILYILPENIAAKGHIKVEERERGIFRVPTYITDIRVEGDFIATLPGVSAEQKILETGTPFLILGIDDTRGITSITNINFNGQTLTNIEAGTRSNIFTNGIHIPLEALSGTIQDGMILDFGLDISLKGVKSLSFIPLGRENSLELASNWPHPSFSGKFLPEKREIDKEGFKASWRVGFLATDAESVIKHNPSELSNIVFKVDLIKPLDIYDVTIRAIKYGLLFIGLTFMAFFVFETLHALRIHPVQYGLLGATLAMFYLLILSLSEHMTFAMAYIIATLSVAGLLGYYASFVVKNTRTGFLYGLMIALLYGTLYLILQSEDYALLAGTFLLFGALALTMIVTRKVDWYSLLNDDKFKKDKGLSQVKAEPGTMQSDNS